jgi:hypothetical protein
LWVISFLLFYQTTGWFEAGHPQLSWLLLFSTLSRVFSRRSIPRDGRTEQDVHNYGNTNLSFRCG